MKSNKSLEPSFLIYFFAFFQDELPGNSVVDGGLYPLNNIGVIGQRFILPNFVYFPIFVENFFGHIFDSFIVSFLIILFHENLSKSINGFMAQLAQKISIIVFWVEDIIVTLNNEGPFELIDLGKLLIAFHHFLYFFFFPQNNNIIQLIPFLLGNNHKCIELSSIPSQFLIMSGSV